MATREEWQGRVGREWARRGDALDTLLDPAGRAGLEALGAAAGWDVLDLGCGGGATTEQLAEIVGKGGHVTGIDISPDLVASARLRVENIPHAEVIEADAEVHDFPPDSFDALYSRFGAMFFANPEAAYRNLHRALRPGGAVSIVAWRDIGLNEWAAVPMTFVAEAMPGTPQMAAPGPGPFAWADRRTFVPLLEEAGFNGVDARPYAYFAEISDGGDPDPVERAVSFMMRVGPLASRLKDATEARLAEARAFLHRRLARHVKEDAVRLPAEAWVITARA